MLCYNVSLDYKHMVIDMSNEEKVVEERVGWGKTTRWNEGEKSPNPNGRPKGKKSVKPRSKMRSTLAQLYPLSKSAISILEESLKVKSKEELSAVDRERISTAKFVVKAIESLNASCLKEELAVLGIREKDKDMADEIEVDQSEEETTSRFSMTMLPTAEDLH